MPLGERLKPYSVTVLSGRTAGISSRLTTGVMLIGTVVASAPGGTITEIRFCESLAVPPAGPMFVTAGSRATSLMMPRSTASPEWSHASRYAGRYELVSMRTTTWRGGVRSSRMSENVVIRTRNEPSAAVDAETSPRGAFGGAPSAGAFVIVNEAPVTALPFATSWPMIDARVSKGASPWNGVGSQPGFGACVTPVGRQASTVQTIASSTGGGVPGWTAPAPSHVSLPLHTLPSEADVSPRASACARIRPRRHRTSR